MWYYEVNRQQFGPVELSQLCELLKSGMLSSKTFVRKAGMANWQPIFAVSELQPFLTTAPSPLPPGMPAISPTFPQNATAPVGPSDDMESWLLPVHTSGPAIVAGYVGLLSIFIFPAPIALILGIYALHSLKKHPGQHGYGRAWFAIILGGIVTALMLFGFVSAILSAC